MRDVNHYQDKKMYLLYAKPAPGAMSGHCALVILNPDFSLTAQNLSELTSEHIDFYYSMYPDVDPSDLRKTPYLQQLRHGLQGYTVFSYNDDVLMRGLSRLRFSKREPEDFSARVLIESGLPDINTMQGQWYFQKGQYDYFVRLPADLDVSKIKESLTDIARHSKWGMFAPLPQLISSVAASQVFQMLLRRGRPEGAVKQPRIHNCCSAIRDSLVAGGAKFHEPSLLLMLPTAALYLLCGVYLAFLHSQSDNNLFERDAKNITRLVPMVYLFYRFGLALRNGHDYFQDLNQMNRKIGFPIQQLVYAVCLCVNAVGAIKTPKALASVFDFPGALFRDVKTHKDALVTEVEKSKSVSFKS